MVLTGAFPLIVLLCVSAGIVGSFDDGRPRRKTVLARNDEVSLRNRAVDDAFVVKGWQYLGLLLAVTPLFEYVLQHCLLKVV